MHSFGTIPYPLRQIRILAGAALKDDVILLLHQDRKDHTIMNYANRVERLPIPHQEALALFVSGGSQLKEKY